MNPQIRFGEDLMSRVSYAMMNPGGDKEMTARCARPSTRWPRRSRREAGSRPSLILETVFVCNPVMHHLLLGIDPVELGQAPFALATSESLTLDARELGLTALPAAARVYVLPCIAGHVGADAAAVALVRASPASRRIWSLIVDVGTNAEILLGDTQARAGLLLPHRSRLRGRADFVAASAPRPARSSAIRIDPDTKEPRFRVIGCDLWSDEAGFAEASPTAAASPASAARASSRRWPRCAWPA